MVLARLLTTIVVVAAVAGSSFTASAADPDKIKQLIDTKSCVGCDLSEAVLNGQNLFEAKLSGANLRDSNLTGATLTGADLSGARLAGANLEDATLIDANLDAIKDKDGKHGVGLQYAHLARVNLTGATMKGALLLGTELRGAKLFGVDLEGAVFQPASLPDLESISDASNLKLMTYEDRPAALLELRKALKEAGFQNQQREITYALMHKRRLDSGLIESFVRYVLFELTSEWGLSPLRPLWLMMFFIFPFAAFYASAIVRPGASAGLWQVWDKDRIRQNVGTAKPVQLDRSNSNVVADALYFSFLSAFSVGWHEINIGTWIGRLNPNEYTLRATGWLRSLSGLQSLVSIFLIVLAFLCYFGDPFD